MKSVVLKRIFIFALVLLISIVACYMYLHRVKTIEPESTVSEVFEIKNTKEIYNYTDSKVITIMKYYMIPNPPDDLQELKKLVEKFIQDNPVDRENGLDANKDRLYEVYFYRKSNKLPRNWQPNEAYFNTDRIGHHTDDCIAVIRWSDLEPQKLYDIMKKSSNNSNYGFVIEEID